MSGSSGPNLRWILTAAALCATLIIPIAWDSSQNWIFPDSISYLDMASDAVHGSLSVLVKNAYWGPAYPAALALMMAVFRPALADELRAAYVVHWILYLFATACFSVFWVSLFRWLRDNAWKELAQDSTMEAAWLCFGYGFFFLVNMNQTLWYLTPDMLLQGTVYLSAAFAIRLFLPGSSWKHSAALGLCLGLGYLTKSAMFPAALFLLGILFLRPPQGGLGPRHSLIAMACFFLMAAPLVLSLSLEKHRFTFGDSGKLNYAMVVGDVPYCAGWTGQNPAYGVPLHAPRKINDYPVILEFRTPVSGTLPLWYDASYWYEGLRVPISLERQLAGFLRPFKQVHTTQSIFLAFVLALSPLSLLSSRARALICEGGIRLWILIVWPGMVCLMYAMVLFTMRYVVGYLVLAALGFVSIGLQCLSRNTRVRALFGASLLLAAVALLHLRPVVGATLHPADSGLLTREQGRDNAASSAAVARELGRLGIRPGDEISALGHTLDCYYARLAGVRIVAQIWEDPDQIVDLRADQVLNVLAKLKQLGVKALVSRGKPGFMNDNGWVPVARTDVYVRIL